MTEPEPTKTEPAVVAAPAPVVTPVEKPTPAAVEPEAPVVVEPVVEDPEDASDAALRAWAKDNNIEGVPGSGKLSAAWREQLTSAMSAALDPKEEGSVKPASPESSSSETTSTTGDSTDQESPGSTEEEKPEPAPEYRSVWQAPETWVSGQTYTA